ncbi:AimR family lysis-lysogeny pheromone receptor [Heyndrickxia sp. FSL K6-6286]|uniref:AimR family lysis-lysogeny pheromone receptor n=1 Tax=Heyndrickxia sp. FSL K6-6286 TaxID=2921510 RepID=UPI00315B313B
MLRKLMYSLMERDDKDIKQKDLAEVIEVDRSQLSHFFNYKKELTFSAWLLAIRFLKPEKEDEIVEILAATMIRDEARQNCRMLMEYASTSRKLDLLKLLITSQKKANKENKIWSNFYEIAYKFQQRNASNEDLLVELESLKPTTQEMRAFSNILKSLIFYMLKEYKCMFRLARIAEKQVKEIKNKFIRDSYMARIGEIFARGYLYLKNDVRKSRFYANMVLNSKFLNQSYKAHTLHLLGTSYLLEDFDMSVEYFNRYKEVLTAGGRNELAKETDEKDIFFAKVLWDKNVSPSDTSDPLERMHYYAKGGDVNAVMKLSAKVSDDDPFALCYLGIALNDAELLLLSIARFIETGDKYFAELPKRYIEEMHHEHIVSAEILYNIKIA